MTNPLAPYVSSERLTNEQFRTLIDSMEEAINERLTENMKDALVTHSHSYRLHRRLITNPVLAQATGYSPEWLSGVRTGKHEVPEYLSHTIQLLHDRVLEHPELAVDAIEDWLERQK